MSKSLVIGLSWALTLLGAEVLAQDCVDQSRCTSQLLRVEVAPNALSGAAGEKVLGALQNFAASPALTAMVQRGYTIKTLPFPHFRDTCRAEKAEGDPDYRTVNCEENGLCSNPQLNPAVRAKICFALPCTMLEGRLQAGACNGVEQIFPTQLGFPGQLQLQNIRLTPTTRSFVNNRAKVCFRIEALELSMSTKLTLNTAGTNLRDSDIQVDNINPRMTEPREACLEATVNLASENLVSDFKLSYPGGPFISDDMLDDAAQRIIISGLSGYPAESLQRVQTEVAPALVQTMRQSIEDGVRDGLEGTFEDEMKKLLAPIRGVGGGRSAFVDSRDFMSELGYANMGVQRPIDIAECTLTRASGKEIPSGHRCLTYKDGAGKPLAFNTNTFNKPDFALMEVSAAIRNKNVTSEAAKRRLLALMEEIRQQQLPPGPSNETPAQAERRRSYLRDDIRYQLKNMQELIDEISQNQVAGPLFNFMEFQREGSSVRIAVPEICSTVRPSPHQGKRIRNCPVQVFADLHEFNQLLDRMWKSGRICQTGRGGFVAELDRDGKPLYYRETDFVNGETDGAPIGSGCRWEMDGMSCYMKAAPKIQFDRRSGNYNMGLELEKCYKGAGIMTGYQGRIGGDLNINVSFRPQACEGGDFCMQNPKATWFPVEGSLRYALRETSRFRDDVDKALNGALNGALGDSIRLPLGSALGDIPLRSQGQVLTGDGFFGVCLELQSGTPP